MARIELTDGEWWSVIVALRAAADDYEAQAQRDDVQRGPELVESLRDSAARNRALADRIESEY